MRTVLRFSLKFLICVILIMKELLDQVYFLLGGIRMVDLQDIKEQNRIEQEERKKTGDRYTVPPKIESQYADLINQTKLANNIESGLNLAIKKRINVTGLFSSPYNKFREIIGTLPKEEQDILTTLRLGFADFVRERGG